MQTYIYKMKTLFTELILNLITRKKILIQFYFTYYKDIKKLLI